MQNTYLLNIDEFLTQNLFPGMLYKNRAVRFINDTCNLDVGYEIRLLDNENVLQSQEKITKACLANNIVKTSELITLLEKDYIVHYDDEAYSSEEERNGFRFSDFYSHTFGVSI